MAQSSKIAMWGGLFYLSDYRRGLRKMAPTSRMGCTMREILEIARQRRKRRISWIYHPGPGSILPLFYLWSGENSRRFFRGAVSSASWSGFERFPWAVELDPREMATPRSAGQGCEPTEGEATVAKHGSRRRLELVEGRAAVFHGPRKLADCDPAGSLAGDACGAEHPPPPRPSGRDAMTVNKPGCRMTRFGPATFGPPRRRMRIRPRREPMRV